MRKEIKIDIPQTEDNIIVVNGIEFIILKSNIDILDDAMNVIDNCGKLDPNNYQQIIMMIKQVIGLIDGILGDGAIKVIMGGRPVNLNVAVNILQEVLGAVIDIMRPQKNDVQA